MRAVRRSRRAVSRRRGSRAAAKEAQVQVEGVRAVVVVVVVLGFSASGRDPW